MYFEEQSVCYIVKKAVCVAILALSEKDRARACVQLNHFRWPESLSAFAPTGWADMSDSDRRANPVSRFVWGFLKMIVPRFVRSENLWIEVLGRTREEHLDWWLAETGGTPGSEGE